MVRLEGVAGGGTPSLMLGHRRPDRAGGRPVTPSMIDEVSASPRQLTTVTRPAAPVPRTRMRAKDICRSLGVKPLPKHVGRRPSKLKCLVSRQILAVDKPGS